MSIATLRRLPIEQRIKLVEDLWDSIAADQNSLELTESQCRELDRRLEAYLLNREAGQPAEVVLAELESRL
ncbi:addiction module protein [Orrella sp. 11846]|uniref:addiction module protein n=1 Tax=Orrella sp. 11846 TaxID=3409913 RepID=UPI003B5B093D